MEFNAFYFMLFGILQFQISRDQLGFLLIINYFFIIIFSFLFITQCIWRKNPLSLESNETLYINFQPLILCSYNNAKYFTRYFIEPCYRMGLGAILSTRTMVTGIAQIRDSNGPEMSSIFSVTYPLKFIHLGNYRSTASLGRKLRNAIFANFLATEWRLQIWFHLSPFPLFPLLSLSFFPLSFSAGIFFSTWGFFFLFGFPFSLY